MGHWKHKHNPHTSLRIIEFTRNQQKSNIKKNLSIWIFFFLKIDVCFEFFFFFVTDKNFGEFELLVSANTCVVVHLFFN